MYNRANWPILFESPLQHEILNVFFFYLTHISIKVSNIITPPPQKKLQSGVDKQGHQCRSNERWRCVRTKIVNSGRHLERRT